MQQTLAVAQRAVTLAEASYNAARCKYSGLVCDAHRREHTAAVLRLADALQESQDALRETEAISNGLQAQGVIVDFVRPAGNQHAQLLKLLLRADLTAFRARLAKHGAS